MVKFDNGGQERKNIAAKTEHQKQIQEKCCI